MVEKSSDIQTSTKENIHKQAQDMLQKGTILDAFKLLLANRFNENKVTNNIN